MFKRVLASLIILPITILLVWAYLSLRNSLKNNKEIAFLLPDNPVMVLDFHHLKSLQQKFQNSPDTSFFFHVAKSPLVQSSLDLLKRAFKNAQGESSIVHALGSNDVFISLHKTNDNALAVFFSVQLANDIDRKVLYKTLEKTLSAEVVTKSGSDIFTIKQTNGSNLYAYYLNSILAVSTNELLIKESWVKLTDEATSKSQIPFADLQELSNELSDLSVYYQPKALLALSENELIHFLPTIENAKSNEWAIADFDFDNPSVFANGYVQKRRTKLPLCGRFSMVNIIPASFHSVSWKYCDDSTFSVKPNDTIKASIVDVFTKELAYVQLAKFGKLNHPLNYAVLNLKSDLSFGDVLRKVDSTYVWHAYKDSLLTIKKNLLQVDSNFFANDILIAKQVGSSLILSESQDELTIYLEQLALENTMARSTDYQPCIDKLFRECSRIKFTKLFADTSLKGTVLPKLAYTCEAYSNNRKQELQIFYIQATDHQYSKPLYSIRKKLDSKVFSATLLHYKKDSVQSIITLSKSKMECFDLKGKLRKSISLKDSIENTTLLVASAKSKNSYLVFHSKSKLFAVNALGKMLSGFPVNLKGESIKNISRIENKDEIRLLVETYNQLYMYDLKGNKVDGWNTPKLKAMATSEVMRVSIGDKVKYLYYADDAMLYAIDSKGKKVTVLDSLLKAYKAYSCFNASAGKLIFSSQAKNFIYDLNSHKCTEVKIPGIVKEVIEVENSKLAIFTDLGVYSSDAQCKNVDCKLKFKSRLSSISVEKLSDNNFMLQTNEGSFLYSFEQEKISWNGSSSVMPVYIDSYDAFENKAILKVANDELFIQYLK